MVALMRDRHRSKAWRLFSGGRYVLLAKRLASLD